ncbi:tyrosine-protein phosphatase [Methylomarinovum caldicuralii]|nr:CpsB/CapC family capsule biosynthesis tyrosine phosphatase [Methylomarinovum caldicuralii]
MDDGASTAEDALAMLEMSQREGIGIQWLTPHLGRPPFDLPWPELQQRFQAFRQQVIQHGLAIEVHLAAEVHIGPHILTLVQQNALPCCGQWEGDPAFLLELPFERIPHGTINLIHWLTRQGVRPILAHPERLRPLQTDPGKLEAFVDAGCLVQVTAASLTGTFGARTYEAARVFLQAGQVHFLASDCHNLQRRPPGLRHGLAVATDLIGETAAKRLVSDNPARLLSSVCA